ncbi:intracellular hyaluronan-binding protein 4 [Dryobates pubescens]|uniref:intracellular hyaluronan-binding protein 4 n=1 Tax=Dryobates pubescens TaxID=118200 RepID=UPI0023B964E2|nr:intracellular hyaluronan-binding protein 4 [Dryobates pubescens]
MLKGREGRPVAAVMQESFGCPVANRFSHLLDDESDPFDVLCEAERQQQQRQKHNEASTGAAAATRRAGPGGRAGSGRREPQKERKQPGRSAAPGTTSQTGAPAALPQRGEAGGPRGAEVKQVPEWKPAFRKYYDYETENQEVFTMERPTERSDHRRLIRGRGRGRGGGINRSFNGFNQRENQKFKRQSGNDTTGMKAGAKKGGGGTHNWGTVKDHVNGMEQTAPVEEPAETAEQPGASEGEPLNKVAEGEPVEEVVQEMTLDEWKNLQQQNRPKAEFNIRKPESTVPSKAVVIHKSKYRPDLQKEDFEDDSHVFRRSVNDITFQLDINFGNLPRPGQGSRGRGGRGHGRGTEEAGPQPKVTIFFHMQPVAPNPDDPEDFPALS